MTPEAIVDTAVANDVRIIAITDHNSARNTERAIDYASAKYPGQILVLAGVEVTTAHGHLLAYFDPGAIEHLRNFIGRINIVRPTIPDGHTAMSMADVATEAERAGGVCIAAHIDVKTGFEAGIDGYPNAKKDILSHPGILGVEVRDAENLGWYSEDDVPTAQGANRTNLFRQRAAVAAARAVLAHVQNSDAHRLVDLVAAHQAKCLTRMKMEHLCFEGFRTALADPDARIRASVKLPRAIPRIIGVHCEGGFLHGETYRISDNLTCFIGGRGTGKSTAIRCIAHGLGIETDLPQFDNCPDSVVVYCEDAQGIPYRYERMRGSVPRVHAMENGKVMDGSPDSFRVEYYGQGDLAIVAADPLSRPDLLQDFLDRHTNLADIDLDEDTRPGSWLKRCNDAFAILSSADIKFGAALLFGLGESPRERGVLVEAIRSWQNAYGGPHPVSLNWAVQHPLRSMATYDYLDWPLPTADWQEAFEDFGEASIRYPLLGVSPPSIGELRELRTSLVDVITNTQL